MRTAARRRRRWSTAAGSVVTAAFEAIRRAIVDGVPKARHYADPMPPKGGAPLSEADVVAVSAYVWAISHRGDK